MQCTLCMISPLRTPIGTIICFTHCWNLRSKWILVNEPMTEMAQGGYRVLALQGTWVKLTCVKYCIYSERLVVRYERCVNTGTLLSRVKGWRHTSVFRGYRQGHNQCQVADEFPSERSQISQSYVVHEWIKAKATCRATAWKLSEIWKGFVLVLQSSLGYVKPSKAGEARMPGVGVDPVCLTNTRIASRYMLNTSYCFGSNCFFDQIWSNWKLVWAGTLGWACFEVPRRAGTLWVAHNTQCVALRVEHPFVLCCCADAPMRAFLQSRTHGFLWGGMVSLEVQHSKITDRYQVLLPIMALTPVRSRLSWCSSKTAKRSGVDRRQL